MAVRLRSLESLALIQSERAKSKVNKDILCDAAEVRANLGYHNARFSGKRILLTGAAGFLGHHFIYYFLSLNDSHSVSKPCQVIAWDNFMRGEPEWLSELSERRDLVIKKVDVREREEFEADFIIHAASIASPFYYRKFPIETIDANVVGLRNLLDHCVKVPCESLLYFSSSEIYGDPDPSNIPTPETYRGFVSSIGPRACYDESKRYGETLAVNFWNVHKIPIKIVRPFNNYGPGLKITDRRVIPDFFRDVLEGREITLFSDGRATRTFCYISDALTGYLLVLLSSFNGEVFNVGTDRPEISMLELAQMVIHVTGANVSIRHEVSEDSNYISDNPTRRCPSIKKICELLDYKPKIDIGEGLRRTYAYYIDNRVAVGN